jgi:UDP-N-acetylmuramate--alanine ligase
VIITPVYAAGETPIEGASQEDLVFGIKARGHRSVQAMQSPDQLAGMVKALARPGDFVMCLGAGTITGWAYALPGELAAYQEAR